MERASTINSKQVLSNFLTKQFEGFCKLQHGFTQQAR
jgi:hypothetical protein